MSGWEPDVLPGYWQQHLRPRPRSRTVRASSRRRWCAAVSPTHRPARAVLMVHGFTDYFFNTELADHFAARGFAFYALDLHKCGRSHRDGQTPHFTTNLARYDVELERAVDAIAAESPARGPASAGTRPADWWCRCGWTGCAAAGRPPARVSTGLILNSPWLDLQGPAVLRTPPTSAAMLALGRLRKRTVVAPPDRRAATAPRCTATTTVTSTTTWTGNRSAAFPVTFGWIHAIRRGQARLHRGLDVGVPNLILRSDRSVREVTGPSRRSHPARRRCPRRRTDRPLGGLHRQPDHDRAHHRRQARCVPVGARAPRNRPTPSWTAGWTGTSTKVNTHD